jgi:hypothetical protein
MSTTDVRLGAAAARFRASSFIAVTRPSPGAAALVLPAESHMIGVEPWKTGRPAASLAFRAPSAAASRVRPVVAAVRFSEPSAGFFAASASCTTRTSEKPLTSAATRRSTPGNTSR